MNALSRKSYNMLGSRASHGCIRLLNHDAQWIYDNAGAGTVVTITEDLPLDPELRSALKPKELSSSWKSAPETPVPTASPLYDSNALPPLPLRSMQKKSSGEDVYWLQMKLKELGYYQGALATGTYLDGTVKAVKAFQKEARLSQDGIAGLTADGVAGIQALNVLYADVLATETPVSVTPEPPFTTPSPTPAP